MFFLGLGSSQSSFTVSLRAKKYVFRSSVIYSQSCRVCDGLLPFFTHLSAVCVCVLALIFLHTVPEVKRKTRQRDA